MAAHGGRLRQIVVAFSEYMNFIIDRLKFTFCHFSNICSLVINNI